MAPYVHNKVYQSGIYAFITKVLEGEIYELTSEINLAPVFWDLSNFVFDTLEIPGQSTLWLCRMIYSPEFFCYFFSAGLSVLHMSFAYVAHFAFLRDVWIRTQRAAIASRLATKLATHLHRRIVG